MIFASLHLTSQETKILNQEFKSVNHNTQVYTFIRLVFVSAKHIKLLFNDFELNSADVNKFYKFRLIRIVSYRNFIRFYRSFDGDLIIKQNLEIYDPVNLKLERLSRKLTTMDWFRLEKFLLKPIENDIHVINFFLIRLYRLFELVVDVFAILSPFFQ